MISQLKKLSIILICLIGFALYGQETFEPGIEIDIPIVSTYIFRGADVFQGKFEQEKKSIKSFNFAPALQPSVTFNFTKGWSFNIWTSFALTNRQDKDTDELLQEGPGDTGTVASAYSTFIASQIFGPALPFSTVESAIRSAISGNEEAYIKGEKFPPAFYKEANGLRRLDEIDLTLSYSFDTKLGTMSGGIVTYLLPNTTKDVIGTDQFTELFVGYSPKILPDLSITFYGEINGDGFEGSTFTYISYSISLIENKDFLLSFDPGIGYQTQNNLQGIKYIDLPLNLSMGNFNFSIVGIYRPDIRFYDSDTYQNDAVRLLGLSTIDDGQIPDPSKNTGLMNSIVNSYIGSTIQTQLQANGYPFSYTYTPRQSIPKFIYYISAGYSLSF
ncbi:MAG: hypothetical protein KatS3mg129_0459 [Leptospiraceae bacterium]|nr:MAG: hypothetical protein KatS3mg129_0459 [Leptospiraceae bacterium]